MSVHPDPLQFTETQSQLTRDLIAARALLRKKGWTQGAFARDVRGYQCATYRPEAATFCAVGAIRSVSADYSFRASRAVDVLCKVIAEGGYLTSLAIWNDEPSRKKEDVLALFDKAILDSMKGTN